MGRSRSRSRSRDRGRRSTRSRSRDRKRSRSGEGRRRRGWDTGAGGGSAAAAAGVAAIPDASGSDAMAAMQAIAVAQQQMQLQRQLLAQQSQQHQVAIQQQQLQMHQQAFVAAHAAPNPDLALDAPPTLSNKKQRELYIGNLTTGVVTIELLRELFNGILANMVPDPISQPPVMDVKPDPTGRGRFAFVELRTAALALAALHLDKMELAGRTLNIGRPKGYIEPPALEQQAKLSAAQQFAAQLSGGPTNTVLLENMMPAVAVLDEDTKRDLHDDVFAEASRCGTITGVAIPTPPPTVQPGESCRVYIKFTTQDAAAQCRSQMNGREFDSTRIKATYVPDTDYWRATTNEWF